MISLAEIPQHNVHGHLAGDFTGGLSAHSIAYNKDSVPRVVSEVIFVVLAYAADIGFARNFHCQCHAMSVKNLPFQPICGGITRSARSSSVAAVVQRTCYLGENWADFTRNIYSSAIRDSPANVDHAAGRLYKPLFSNMMAGLFLVDH